MDPTGKTIQALVIFSALLGVAFLWEVNGVLPAPVFYFVAAGWVAFVLDGVLTFRRPVLSCYLAFVLAILALASSLPQSAHYALLKSGDLLRAGHSS